MPSFPRRQLSDCSFLAETIFFLVCAKFMYNGVGVQTARGTGTSGHVTKNLSALRPVRFDVKGMKEMREKQAVIREADPGIVHHNSLRQIEVELLELRDQLEDAYVLP